MLWKKPWRILQLLFLGARFQRLLDLTHRLPGRKTVGLVIFVGCSWSDYCRWWFRNPAVPAVEGLCFCLFTVDFVESVYTSSILGGSAVFAVSSTLYDSKLSFRWRFQNTFCTFVYPQEVAGWKKNSMPSTYCFGEGFKPQKYGSKIIVTGPNKWRLWVFFFLNWDVRGRYLIIHYTCHNVIRYFFSSPL